MATFNQEGQKVGNQVSSIDKNKLIEKVKSILAGIDEDEVCSDSGWWETSTGAEFGKRKLEAVIAAIENA